MFNGSIQSKQLRNTYNDCAIRVTLKKLLSPKTLVREGPRPKFVYYLRRPKWSKDSYAAKQGMCVRLLARNIWLW